MANYDFSTISTWKTLLSLLDHLYMITVRYLLDHLVPYMITIPYLLDHIVTYMITVPYLLDKLNLIHNYSI